MCECYSDDNGKKDYLETLIDLSKENIELKNLEKEYDELGEKRDELNEKIRKLTNDMNKTVVADIVNEPRNFIGMTFYDNFKFFTRINYSIDGAVIINVPIVNERLNIIEPKFLSRCFKAGR